MFIIRIGFQNCEIKLAARFVIFLADEHVRKKATGCNIKCWGEIRKDELVLDSRKRVNRSSFFSTGKIK